MCVLDLSDASMSFCHLQGFALAVAGPSALQLTPLLFNGPFCAFLCPATSLAEAGQMAEKSPFISILALTFHAQEISAFISTFALTFHALAAPPQACLNVT